jgi:hypothetical protein
MDNLLDQLSQAGFPKVKLFIAYSSFDRFLDYNDDYLVHPYHTPFLKYVFSSPATFTNIDTFSGMIVRTIRIGQYRILYYTAEQRKETGTILLCSMR